MCRVKVIKLAYSLLSKCMCEVFHFVTKKKDSSTPLVVHREKCLVSKQADEEQRRREKESLHPWHGLPKKSEEKKTQQGV